MKNDTAQVRMATQKQMQEVYATLMQGVPALSFEIASHVLAHKSELITHTGKFFPSMDDLTNPIKQWEDFYFKVFGLKVDFSGIKIPERTEAEKRGFTRLIIVLQGLSLNSVYGTYQRYFKCCSYPKDLDLAIPQNERSNITSYAIWVRDIVKADEVRKNKSADMMKKEGLKTETVLECMIHELKYFLESGKKLDISKITYCSGSRSFDGDVPAIYWRDNVSCMSWCSAGNLSDNICFREVIA